MAKRDDGELYFENVAQAAKDCSRRNSYCEDCPDEASCKKWWDTEAVEVNSLVAQQAALANAPFHC